MPEPATEKQIAYRASLMESFIAKRRAYSAHGTPGLTDLTVDEASRGPVDGRYLRVDADDLPGIATALAFPEPADSADCSDQIDSLKSGSGYGYAAGHREWAMPVLARLAAAYGDQLERAPKVITVAELRAIATGASNG